MNNGRNNLVTRFKCSKCGNQLALSNKKDDGAKGNDYERDDITGACKVEVDIFIEPCRNCIEKPKKELDTLRKILGAKD